MNTGGPLDLTAFGSVLTGIGILYCLVALAGTALALWLPKRGWVKAAAALTVLAAFGFPVINYVGSERQHRQQADARFAAAKARFEERCKSAGGKIYRTVDNVDGLLLLNIRPTVTATSYADPNWADAALPRESRGAGYIRSFLFWEHHDDKRNERGYLNNQPSELPGYGFVDVRESADATYRYRLTKSEVGDLARVLVTERPARYAVSFVNLTNAEDRERWIAGTKVSIIDTVSNEVIAEKTWFSFEPGQGSTAGFRSPWALAQSCPSQAGMGGSATRFFVDQVLKTIKEK